MTGEQAERERDLERFLTFVDAIAAIAITLLVLPLVEISTDLSGSVSHLFDEHRSQFGAFLLSFFVIARLWYSQHHAVRSLVRLNTRVFWLLMVWTLCIVVVPFGTALVAQAGGERLTKIVYIGPAALSMLVLGAVDRQIERHPEIGDGSGPTSTASLLVNAWILIVVLALNLAVPSVSYYPMLLLTLDNLILRALRRHGSRRQSASGGGPMP